MCLAVPGRIVALAGNRARVDLAGNTVEADVSLLESPQVGDWVVVHAGFALEKLDEEAARETLALVRELASPGRGRGSVTQ
ncbi:MAG: HypC/HybG/HupF family hydrogenase formation chaperone [Actinomycetia bacterium]|nr:HypC/HybG/HupF family hydrogenase formation chaperone [Actinomycetes bacterium]